VVDLGKGKADMKTSPVAKSTVMAIHPVPLLCFAHRQKDNMNSEELFAMAATGIARSFTTVYALGQVTNEITREDGT